MNCGGWPMNRPSPMRKLAAATALIWFCPVGLITAQRGRFGLMNSHGTGKIRFVCSRGLGVASKLGKVNPLVGSVKGAMGGCTPLPAKSTHSKRSEEHTSELQSLRHLACRLLLEKK